MPEKKVSIKKNYVYNTAYQLLAMLAPLITTPYISRIFGADGVGRYSYAHSVADYFILFIMLGVSNYGCRTIAEYKNNRESLKKEFWSIYLLQVFMACIVTIIYLIYACFIADDHAMSTIMVVYVVSAGLDISWAYFGLELFRLTTIRSGIIKLLTIILLFLMVRDESDIYIYAGIYVTGFILSQIILWLTFNSNIGFSKVSIMDIYSHVKPNVILFIPVLAISLYKIMDKVMLGVMSGTLEVGYYASCEKVIKVPMALIVSLGNVMLPRISNMLVSKEFEKSKAYLEKSIQFAMFLSCSIGFGIIAVADIFVPVFYGEGYEKCINVFEFLMISCIFLAFANVIRTQYLIPNKKDKIYIVSVWIGAIINLAFNAVLIPKYGSVGAAIGTLFAEGSVCVVQSLGTRKEIHSIQLFVNSIPFLLSGIIMSFFIRLISINYENLITQLLFKIALGCIIYMTCILIFYYIKNKGFMKRKCK